MSAIVPIAPPFPDAKALVGVSGGRDSIALLHALAQGGWRSLTVCHLDHGLRAKSEDDARFVAERATSYGLDAVIEREDVALRARQAKQSIETAARAARYEFFARVQRSRGGESVFLAHHADDQVETFLFRLLRGSGAMGLAAMRPIATRVISGISVEIVRPFLSVWRAEIDAYIAAHALPFREDPSNAEPSHTRNRLRHDALPALEAAMGRDVRVAIWRAAEILTAEDELVSGLPELQKPLPPTLSTADLCALPVALQRRQIHRWLRDQGVRVITFDVVETVRSLLTRLRPAKVNLPGGHHVRRRTGRLFIERSSKAEDGLKTPVIS